MLQEQMVVKNKRERTLVAIRIHDSGMGLE